MKLSIVVTHYNEPFEVGKKLFRSIAEQIHIDKDDYEVLLINDGKDVTFPYDCLDEFGFNYKYMIKKHEGVSAARNFGLDRAQGDYVMFCDFDDMFISLFAFHLLSDAIKNEPDVIFGCFMEELLIDGEYTLTRRDKDSTFIHGKVFKREYLKGQNIRFNDNLTIHEDSYFVCLARTLTDNHCEIKVPFYMWCWNANSVVRNDREHFVLRTYKNIMDSRIALCEQLWNRGEVDKYCNVVCKAVLDAYYDSNKPEWLDPANAELVANAEKEFKRFYTKYGKDYRESNINRIGEVAYLCRDMAYRNGLKIESHTVSEWLNHIVKDV